MVVENSPESQQSVENHRFTLCERFCERGCVWSNGPLRVGKGEPSLLADVALTEELRGSKDAGLGHPEPSSSATPAKPA